MQQCQLSHFKATITFLLKSESGTTSTANDQDFIADLAQEFVTFHRPAVFSRHGIGASKLYFFHYLNCPFKLDFGIVIIYVKIVKKCNFF